jgi:hypothetical protein
MAPSPLGLVFSDGSFGENLRISGAARMDTTLDYELFTGKASKVHSRYRQSLLRCRK